MGKYVTLLAPKAENDRFVWYRTELPRNKARYLNGKMNLGDIIKFLRSEYNETFPNVRAITSLTVDTRHGVSPYVHLFNEPYFSFIKY